MTDFQYSQVVLDEISARAEAQADPGNDEKFRRWTDAYRTYRREQRNRMDRSYAAQYLPVQFERQPDEGLL